VCVCVCVCVYVCVSGVILCMCVGFSLDRGPCHGMIRCVYAMVMAGAGAGPHLAQSCLYICSTYVDAAVRLDLEGHVLARVQRRKLFCCFVFGVGWGIGGVGVRVERICTYYV
jgi:hypothetical protein